MYYGASGPHNILTIGILIHSHLQRAKKVVSDSLGLVDFAVGLANSVLNLPNGQVMFLGETQITEELLSILLINFFSG